MEKWGHEALWFGYMGRHKYRKGWDTRAELSSYRYNAAKRFIYPHLPDVE